MARRIGIAVAAIIVVIVVAAAVAPYFVGLSAESNFKSQVAYLDNRIYADRGFSLKIKDYERGFYSSDVTLALSGNPGSTETMSKMWRLMLGTRGDKAVFHLHINHGPIPFSAFDNGHVNFMPVLYTAAFRGKSLPRLSLLGVLKPTSYIVQSFTGTTHVTLVVPPGQLALSDALKVRWQGARLVSTINGAHDRGHYEGRIDAIDLTLHKGPDEARRIHFKGARISGTKTKRAHDFWVGSDSVQGKGMTVKWEDEPPFRTADWHYKLDISQTRDGRRTGGKLDLGANDGSIEGWAWTHVGFHGKVGKLDSARLRKALDHMSAAGGMAKTPQMGSLSRGLSMFSLFSRAVTRQTRGTFGFELKAPSGTFNADSEFSFDPPEGDKGQAGEPPLRMDMGEAANARIRIDFDRGIVMDFSRKVIGADTAREADEIIRKWLAKGYLEKRDGRLHMTIVNNDGELSVNGQQLGDEEEQPSKAPPASTIGH